MKKIGFIGCGNMGSTMIGGMTGAGRAGGEKADAMVAADQVMASCASESSAKKRAEALGIEVTTDNRKVAEFADILFLAVKPNMFESVIPQIAEAVTEKTCVVSIAAGQTIEAIEKMFGKKIHLVRAMPNTPALVGEGMTGVCCNEEVSDAEMQDVLKILESCGKAEMLSERLIDVVVSVSGSSPAYVFMFIEAMADAAVAEGMPRAQAYKFAAQAVLGSAKMVLETGKHPGELKDMVCSPAGTTIEAVGVLEEHGFRSAVIDAMKACVDVAKGM